mgnify:CR=1 FL=1
MMILNGKYPFWGEKSNLRYIIKQADSINKVTDDCGYILEDSYEIWYYANCEIEISGTEYVFVKIDLNTSHFSLKHKEVIFSENVTIQPYIENFSVMNNFNLFFSKNSSVINIC